VDPAKEAALAGRKNAEQPATETAQGTTAAPAPAETQPAPAQPTPAPADQPAATERGQSPLIYAGGAVVVAIVAFLLGRRRRKGS
jgi:LPXTG-motif cell wall-anchored protein